MTYEHVVLVGMSVSDAAAIEGLRAVASGAGVSVAYLQLGEPSLGRVLDGHAGAKNVALVGVTLGGGVSPGVSWLRRTAAHWWREHPAQRPEIVVATRLVREPASLEVVLADTKPITGSEPALISAAWENVPRHRHQVFVCRGPRCTAKRSDETAEAFHQVLDRLGLGDDDVLVTQTGCQFPCNHGPVVTVQPDNVRYGGVTEDVVDQIVGQHLVGGEPVAAYRLPRQRSEQA